MQFIMPVWAMLVVAPFVLLLLIFWIWAIIHVLSSKLRVGEKIMWLLVILFLHVLGAVLYFLLAKSVSKQMASAKPFKGKKLLRSKKHRMIAGVCGGIGEYFGVDPTPIRLLWVLVTLFSGLFPGVIAYLIAWMIMPEK